MVIGIVLLALAALVLVVGAVCWLAGVQLMALVKVLLTGSAALLALAGTVVVSGDLLLSAGYFNSGRADPNNIRPTPSPTTERFVTTEEQQLRWMHEHAVGVFIEGPGFGSGRMLPNLTDIVTASKKSLDNKEVAWGPTVREAGKGRVHNGVQGTIANAWMGALTTPNGTETWKVRKIHLLGLIQHPEPVVYLTDQTPNMKNAANVPTRELDAFEKAGLDALRRGENMAVEKNSKDMRVLGPIFAGSSCVKCHEPKGLLLGAFTYQLERVAAATSQTREAP